MDLVSADEPSLDNLPLGESIFVFIVVVTTNTHNIRQKNPSEVNFTY